MGLLNSALQIGRSAISGYQGALSVVGNNIANAADPNYSRQRAVLDPVTGAPLPEGIRPGGGVALTSLQRILNESLEGRLREAIGHVAASEIQSQYLTQIENSFNELTDNDISSMLSSLFNAFQDVQNDPTDLGLREVIMGQAGSLADALRTRRSALQGMIEEINDQIEVSAFQANDLAQQIADLNIEVVRSEANGQTASALRDQRDALLRDLGEIVDISVRPHESGTVSVFIGNESLVQLGSSRGLTTTQIVEGDSVRIEVRFADNSGTVEIQGGQLAGLMASRDTHITDVVEDLDQLASGLINTLNQIHTNGQGIKNYTSTTGVYAVSDADRVLNDAGIGLNLIPRSGSFYMAVTDVASGVTNAYQIDIDLDGLNGDDTTLNSLIDQINANVLNVTARLTVDNKLALSVTPGFEFSFGHDGVSNREDSSDVLAALGVNIFYQGKDSSDIQVSESLRAQPEFLGAAGANIVGDGSNAGQLAIAGQQLVSSLDNATLSEFYIRTIGDLGVDTAAAQAQLESTDSVRSALEAQRSSISGVNLDEEAVDLLRFQRAFEGAARYTSIVNQLISEMLNIVR